MSHFDVRERLRERLRYAALHVALLPRGEVRANPLGVPARVLVSLTTTPARIRGIRPTLASLVDQSLPPDAIVLNLPHLCEREGRGYEIPASLAQFPRLRVERCERDFGPATKLIPTLLRGSDPDAAVIVVDDDQIYPRELVANLLRWSEQLPDAALCHRGFRVPRNFEQSRRNTIYAEQRRDPEPIEIIQGSAGYLVRPRFFGPALFDYGVAPPAARTRDDVWVSGQLARAGVDRFVVPLEGSRSRLSRGWVHRRRALSHHENRDDREGVELYRFFESDWKFVD